MTVREYLERPETLRLEISRKRTRIETLRRLATRFSAGFTDVRVRSSPDPARMQAFLAEAADEESEIALLGEKQKQAVADAALLISRLPDKTMARIMELRYLDKCSWEEIVEQMDCSAASVFRLHRQALDILSPPPEIPDEKKMDSWTD